jgi:ketosteroid isomerase-like protein
MALRFRPLHDTFGAEVVGVAALVACFIGLAGCNLQVGQTPPPDTRVTDEAAVRAASAEWAKVASAKDLEKTLSYYAEDASMFPPNMPIVTGSEARRKMWTTLFAPAELVFSNAATKVEVARSGDLAYEIGTFEESFKDAGGSPVKVVGKYVVVWKKQPGGEWKAIIDIFNTDQ